jgi:anti-sigma regulatory factor (Ser/Thr protein kinase)
MYATGEEYAHAVGGFIRDGIDAGEPVFAAVPPARIRLLEDTLGAAAAAVEFADMTEIGRNPAWIIPRVLSYTGRNSGRHVRYVGEPIWPARTKAELREATKHESLINLALADSDADILCPYDTAALAPDVISDAARTHPLLLRDGHLLPSIGYAVPFEIPASCDAPLAPPPADAMPFSYGKDLCAVRALVSARAWQAGLSGAKAGDLVLAVSEAAANTLRHAQSRGALSIWQDSREIVCEIRDDGVITDPLAGRRRPAPDAAGGHGLWLVHQVCDLVEMRSGGTGTTIRMHMSLGLSAART